MFRRCFQQVILPLLPVRSGDFAGLDVADCFEAGQPRPWKLLATQLNTIEKRVAASERIDRRMCVDPWPKSTLQLPSRKFMFGGTWQGFEIALNEGVELMLSRRVGPGEMDYVPMDVS